jgi:hypothetical protein
MVGLGVGGVLGAGKGLLELAQAEGCAGCMDWERWVGLVDLENWSGQADYRLLFKLTQSFPSRAAAEVEWSWTHMRWPDLAAMPVQPALLLVLVPPCLAALLLAWEDSLLEAEDNRASGLANVGMDDRDSAIAWAEKGLQGVAEKELEGTQHPARKSRHPQRIRRRGSLSRTPEGRGRTLPPTASAPAPSTPRALRQLTRSGRLCVLAYPSRFGVVAEPRVL